MSESEVHGLELLGGLITVRTVRGDARAAVSDRGTGRAESSVAGVRVAGLRAEIGPKGLIVDDRTLGREQLEALNAALEGALDRVGLEISPGRERVRRKDESATALAYALSVDFRRQNVPEGLPERTQGADVFRVPVGLAAADAGVAVLPPVRAAEPPAAPADADTAPPEGVSVQPVTSVFDAGVALAVVVFVGVAALAAALGLTWLKVNEVLTE